MSSYSNFVLTNHGMGLLADLLGSAGELEFRYMAIGAGVYSLEEKDKAAIRNMSSLKDERQQANFLSIKKLENTEGVVELKAHFTNQEISDEYQMTEIGIYAGKKGAEEEVLYCVAFWEGTPDTMPDFTTGKIHDVKFKVLIGIGDVSNVTIAYTQDTYVLADDFLDHVDDNTIHLSKEKRECWDKKLGTTDNTGDNTVIFDSGDEDESESSINRWEDIAVVESGEKHSSLWEKFSLLVKNFRFLKKVLGTKDISKIGDGTLTGAIYELNTGMEVTTLKPLLDTLTIRYVHCIKKGNIALCSMEMSLSEEIRRVTRLISGLPTPIVHYTGIVQFVNLGTAVSYFGYMQNDVMWTGMNLPIANYTVAAVYFCQ